MLLVSVAKGSDGEHYIDHRVLHQQMTSYDGDPRVEELVVCQRVVTFDLTITTIGRVPL